MHDGYVFKDTKHHVDDVELHNMLFDAFYRDLRDIGVEGYKQIRKTKEIGARILADNCGKTIEQIMKDFDRDYWMNAKEAVNYGIVDTIMTKI